MYENAIAWMIGQADDRARERADRARERAARAATTQRTEHPSRLGALLDRFVGTTDRRSTVPACCPA